MESTLNSKLDELEGEVGFYLGFGRGAKNNETAWSTTQQGAITSCVKMALHWFYYPIIDGAGVSHTWSFLHPTLSVTLASGANSIALPDDFGGLEGTIVSTTSGSAGYRGLDLVNERRIAEAFGSFPTATGWPQAAALVPLKGVTASKSSRWQLNVYPAANADYTLSMPSYINPDMLSGQQPYIYGGPQHAETIRAACIAAAELTQDGVRGPQWASFQERLATSISMDRRTMPQRFGRNRDRSDELERYGWRQDRSRYDGIVTVGGVTPD